MYKQTNVDKRINIYIYIYVKMNDKQQEQNFPSSSIIKDVDNKFHQLLKETVHDFLFQPLEKKTCTNPIISNLLMHEVKVSTSQQQPRTSGFFDSRKTTFC